MTSYTLNERLLTIEGVHVAYGDTPILYNCSQRVRNITRPGTDIQQGQVVAILGPSGIGKTTLFNVMAGLQAPHKGRVLVTNKQVPVERGMIGVVSQHYPLFAFWSVYNNLLEAAKRSDIPRDDRQKRIEEMLATFGLTKQRHLYPDQLSGGQRQRTAIAQQLLNSHQTLLMDEPFSGLDVIRLQSTCDVIRKVAQLDELFTIILVTHDIPAALTVADTVWLMGRVRDEKGTNLGARLVEEINLIDRGIAWHERPRSLPQFTETLHEIEARFPSLV